MAYVIPELVIGVALLVVGRRLFWVFVGGVGFLIGVALAPRLFPEASQATILMVSLGLGLVGAILALLFQRFAIGVAGFIVGGIAGYLLANSFGLGNLPLWFSFLLGGIIGAVLVAVLFDWALIILSSIAGAGLILDALRGGSGTIGPATVTGVLQSGSALSLALFVILLAVGLLLQSRQMRRG